MREAGQAVGGCRRAVSGPSEPEPEPEPARTGEERPAQIALPARPAWRVSVPGARADFLIVLYSPPRYVLIDS